MIALAVAHEWRAEGVAGNARLKLWCVARRLKFTKLETQSFVCEPEIVSDAAMLLLQTDPTILTGQTLTVLEFLRSEALRIYALSVCARCRAPLVGRSLPTVVEKQV